MGKDPTRKNRMTRLSKLVNPMIEPSLRARGFVLTRLVSHWPQIAGDMANWSQPAELKFPHGETSNGTLRLAIASGRGPQAAQEADALIKRVNAEFGYAAVSRITLSQTLPPREAQSSPSATSPDRDQAARNQRIWSLDERLQKVESPILRAALRRLGTPLDQ